MTIQSIHERLSVIQKNIKAPKTQYNKFGGYNYRKCEDILEAVKPLCGDNEFILVSDKIVQIENRIYVQTTASFCKGSEKISVEAYAREPDSKKGMDESQITGATSSYARKYALNGLLAIDDAEDPDADSNHYPTPPQRSVASKQASVTTPQQSNQPTIKKSKPNPNVIQPKKTTSDGGREISIRERLWNVARSAGINFEQLEMYSLQTYGTGIKELSDDNKTSIIMLIEARGSL